MVAPDDAAFGATWLMPARTAASLITLCISIQDYLSHNSATERFNPIRRAFRGRASHVDHEFHFGQ
jgi:hypothetical protein